LGGEHFPADARQRPAQSGMTLPGAVTCAYPKSLL
jgi:hypothetical protein